MATLSLTVKQKAKGMLISITALSSMYLFSVLEVKDERDEEHDHLKVLEIGGVGLLTLLVVVAIDIYVTLHKYGDEGDEDDGEGSPATTNGQMHMTSSSRLSTGDINNGMSIGALV